MRAFVLLLLALASAEDRNDPEREAHLARVAAAIWAESAHAPRPPGEWRSLMAAVGIRESGFSRRIMAGRCKRSECDHGLAAGGWQLHANALNRAEWERQAGDIELQAKLASAQLKRAFRTCERSGVPWLVGTLNAYAGKRCGADHWPGLDQRIQTFNRLQRLPVRKGTP